MRDQKNPGREWPGESEPREIATPPAARDQTKASPQPVRFNDTAPNSVVQMAGGDRFAQSEIDGGSGDSVGNPVMVRAAVYARTATPKGSGEAGLDMQVARCLRYAAEHQYDVSPEHIWRVVGSGVDPRLDGLTELMEVIDAGELDVVMVCGVGRLSRSMVGLVFVAQLMRAKGVHVVDVGESGGRHLTSPVEVANAGRSGSDDSVIVSRSDNHGRK